MLIILTCSQRVHLLTSVCNISYKFMKHLLDTKKKMIGGHEKKSDDDCILK